MLRYLGRTRDGALAGVEPKYFWFDPERCLTNDETMSNIAYGAARHGWALAGLNGTGAALGICDENSNHDPKGERSNDK